MKLCLSLVAALFLAACGSSNNDKSEESYHFKSNGCDTERHVFSSDNADETRRQLCAALQDDSLNRGCAEGMRRSMFEQKCGGTWNPH